MPTNMMRQHRATVLALQIGLAIVAILDNVACAADEFASRIAPLVRQHCVKCHGPDRQEGELRLDDLAPQMTNPKTAARWRDVSDRVRTGEMPPPDETPLKPDDRKFIVEWIRRQLDSTQDARNHWAFQPLRPRVPVTEPTANAWSRSPVDGYVLARMAQARAAAMSPVAPQSLTPTTATRPDASSPAQSSDSPHIALTPSPPAERATLLRRVMVDLVGLPPTPAEVAEFQQDESPDAWERVVDRLLASPHYGERWGRHWLDLVLYADSSGFHNDLDRPHAWKYRDYVIRSLNRDKPFTRFVAEQLAGDEVEDASEETLIATGFGRNGPSNDDNMGKTPEAIAQYRADQLDQIVSTTGTVFLGITIGCARCHNHKTEPLASRDYYGLFAVFQGVQKHGLVPGTEDATGKKVAVDASVQIQGLVERSAKPPPTFLMRRGSATNLGEEVSPAVPAVLSREPIEFPQPEPSASSSLRRRTLARWITAPDNPLTWRVLANRVWQHHFGRGLVATPSNFGVSGASPTHPELLDWLAGQLVEHEGALKPLHRTLLTSATYQQSSAPRAEASLIDPDNRWLWRMNLRRLEAEVLRDGILAASGNLNRRAGGPGIKPRIRSELLTASQRNKWPVIERESAAHWRRSVYIYAKRQLLMPLLELFDAPTTTDSCPVRSASVVPTQALVLMNDEFTEDQAEALVASARAEVGEQLSHLVACMFRRTVARVPTGASWEEVMEFVRTRGEVVGSEAALVDLAHVIFNSSEFLYVE